jgi:adenylate cyclase
MRGLRRTRVALLLALVPGVIGAALVRWPPAAGLERSGLDLLFLARGERPSPPGVCVVAIDSDSYRELGVDPKATWPRGLHADLIRKLQEAGASAVAFDVLFEGEGDPDQDMAFLWALEDSGKVVLGRELAQLDDPRFRRVQLRDPWEPFSNAAALGLVGLPADRDEVIRSTWLVRSGMPSLALAAYEVATGDTSLRGREETRLIDYYGPARRVNTVSVYQALDPEQWLPEGFFRGRIVFVGLSESAATGPAAKDAFPTPFRGARGQTTYGVEIHATIAANLLEHRQIDLLPPNLETLLLFLLPIPALLVFTWLRPLYGTAALVALAAVPWATALVAFNQRGFWLPTIIPSAIQLPLAYTISVLWYYLTTVRERERVKRAFSLYLSPEAARQVAEDPSALNLGGEEIVATAMFTDIAGFTSVAESMTAEETAAMLNRYFSEATGHVFETGGTLVKYIGDAVFAIWGAPVRVPDHAARACRAALALARMDARQGDSPDPAKRLRTRIGVHSGFMLVGNLGSAQRFDYTAIGDAVNLASRIEGLNKMFGTRAIVSGDALAAAGEGFTARRLGRVRVVGRSEPVALFELLAAEGMPPPPGGPDPERFEEALRRFEAGEFDRAEDAFREVIARAGGRDGPSSLYVSWCERYRREGAPEPWDGVITAESK